MTIHKTDFQLPRRAFLAGSGALVMTFALPLRGLAQGAPALPEAAKPPELPGALQDAPMLDSWIRIDADGSISVFTGKAELGQGIRTALLQCAAEELRVDPASISLTTADTGATPDEGYTAGSMSMQNSGTAIRNAAAQVREILVAEAALKLAMPAQELVVEKGSVWGNGRRLGYGEIVSGSLLHVNASPGSILTPAAEFKVMGRSLPRVDITGKVTGGQAYIQDFRPEGMVHARVVRPPSYGASLLDVDIEDVGKMPGVLKVVRDGSYLAVIASEEFQAVRAMRALARSAKWQEKETLPDMVDLPRALRRLASEDGIVAQAGASSANSAQRYEATFTRAYQMHGSIGPSCAVALHDGDLTTVWTHTQGVYPDRDAIAELLGVDKSKVRCIHVEGSGCYGHNGADDAAGDAALLAREIPRSHVRVQYMREQEHAWEPYGPGMVTHIAAGIDSSGRIADWNYEIWSNNHGTRPGSAGQLVSANYLSTPFSPDVQKLKITPNGNGDRNADPPYTLPNKHVVWHFLGKMPLRVSSLRALGAYMNVFAIESAMDELAIMAKADPVEFRLAHLEEERARAVVEAAAKGFGWQNGRLGNGRGRGFAYARYKNHAAYFAIALEVEVDPTTGRVRVTRASAAIDSGEAVNPDGIRNQTEGGIMQSMSWTLFEAVTFDRTRITSVDWAMYPILRFASVPETIDVEIMDRPGEPFLGTGEAAQGPTAAAIGNAVRDAIGVRLRDLPLNADRVRNALRV